MLIGGLQKFTLIDYPGKLAATVFLCGCNFLCPWCYSSELVLPEKIKKKSKISEKEFFKFLKSKRGLLEGITVCGGEPTINKDLPKFIKKIKKIGYLVKIDTNGSNPQMLKDLIDKKLIDYVAMDIKAPLGLKSQIPNPLDAKRTPRRVASQTNSKIQILKYGKATGVKINLEKIRESIEIIKNSGIEYEFRTTVIPTIHTKEDIIQIARGISPAKRYYLQNFRPEKTIDLKFEKVKPYPEKYLLEIQKAISPFFDVCQVR